MQCRFKIFFAKSEYKKIKAEERSVVKLEETSFMLEKKIMDISQQMAAKENDLSQVMTEREVLKKDYAVIKEDYENLKRSSADLKHKVKELSHSESSIKLELEKIKIQLDEKEKENEAVAREISIMRRLQHSNICRMLNVFWEPTRTCENDA